MQAGIGIKTGQSLILIDADTPEKRKRCFQATALRSCFRYAHGSS
jgi:hypothetical protein